MCSKVNVCTVHAEMTVDALAEAKAARHDIDRRLKDAFNLQHITIQLEQETTTDNSIQH